MPTGYCTSKGTNYTYEWIDYVGIGTISNTTAKNSGYGDFTTLSTNVNRSATYTLTMSAGFKSTKYTEYWTIYIDWNRDGDFTDAGEEVSKGYSSSSGNLTASITVPATASLGTTRMRVSMKYNSYQTSCETFSYGEVEDYALVIGTAFAFTNNFVANSNSLNENEKVADVNVFPVPFTNELNISLSSDIQSMSYEIINVLGAVVMKDKVNSNVIRINTSDLSTGVYTLRINDGQKTTIKKILK